MAAFTLDELVIRLDCLDGTLFVDRQWLMHISQTFKDLQDFQNSSVNNGSLINDVQVNFDRRVLQMLIKLTHPTFIPPPQEEYSAYRDQILLALDWLGPIDETESIVREAMGLLKEPNQFVCVLSACNRVTPGYVGTVDEDKLVEFVTKFNGGLVPKLIQESDLENEEDMEYNQYEYEMDNCDHKFIMDACGHNCKKTMHCVRKFDQTIPEIVREINDMIF